MAKATVRSGSAVKMCLNPACHKILPLTEFYKNRNWSEQSGVDLYCKECARQMCVDKESIRKYCWENNRLYSEDMWNAAEKKAMYYLANNAEYLSDKTSKKKKEEIKNRYICNQFFLIMNTVTYYSFVDNTAEGGVIRDFDPESMDGTLVSTEDGEQVINDGAKIYSPTWNGFYTRNEIEYLDGYYERLNEGFVLDDVNIQDYAKKVAKASLEADTRYNNMRIGKCSSGDWKEAQAIFDNLCKSANFAACQKKDKGAGSNEVLCEIIANIEINHQADMPQVFFEEDHIDLILKDFAHTYDAIK